MSRSVMTPTKRRKRGRFLNRVFRGDKSHAFANLQRCLSYLLSPPLQPLGGGGIRVRRFSSSHALLPMEPELILAPNLGSQQK